jgi:hypothetical protein
MRSFVLPLLLSLAPPVASAQVDTATISDSAVPKAGAEVRITTRVGRSYSGRLYGVTTDSVRILTPGADRMVIAAIPRDSVARFEVNYRGGSHAGVGALIGLGTGAVVGVVIASADCLVFCTPQQEKQSNTDFITALVAGGVLGALLGSSTHSSHWREVPLDRVAVTVRPAAAGVGLGLSVRFSLGAVR